MKETMKNLVKSTFISVGISLSIFCFIGIVFDMIYKGIFSLENYMFTKMVTGCVLIGLGFGVPSVIYQKDSLPMPIKILIHMGTGCVVYTIVAYSVGWIGGSSSFLHGILIAAVQFAAAFIIWLFFMKYYRNEAKKMNEKIQELKK